MVQHIKQLVLKEAIRVINIYQDRYLKFNHVQDKNDEKLWVLQQLGFSLYHLSCEEDNKIYFLVIQFDPIKNLIKKFTTCEDRFTIVLDDE